MSGVTDADRQKAMRIAGWWPLIYESFAGAAAEGNPDDLDALHTVDAIAAALAEEREKGIDIGLRNATSIDHYEVGHCCRLCGQTWPCDRAETVGLR